MKAGIVGCGAIGSRYLGWLRELGNEVAMCDPAPDRRSWAEREVGAAAFADLAGLFQWRPNRLIVATPPHAHEAPSLAAMDAGISLLIEKPLAHDLDAGRRLAAAAGRARCPVRVVCNMRFHKGVEAIKANLSRVGRPLAFRGVFGHRLSQMRSAGGDFARSAATGGGVVMDCIHEFDYLRWIFGPIAEIRSSVAQVGDDKIGAEDLAQVILTFQSGIRGTLHLDFLMRQKRRGLEVIGTEGNLVWLSTGRSPEVCRVTFGDQSGETILVDDPNLDARASYMAMLRHFLAASDELQTVDEALSSLEATLIARGGV